MSQKKTRRSFLGDSCAVSAVWIGGGCVDLGAGGASHYLTRFELRNVDALAEFIHPGAASAGAGGYIDQLLSAFDHEPPRIFASGPYSGRSPYPAPAGGASKRRPDNAFRQYVPLSRLEELAFRIRLFGSEGTQGAGFVGGALPAVKGYRDLYRDGLHEVSGQSDLPCFYTLPPARRPMTFERLERRRPTFVKRLIEHVCEAMYAAPEYGGNRRLAGWRHARVEGDTAPLGYAQYSMDANRYVESAAHPVSTSGPQPERGFSESTLAFLETVVAFADLGQRFF